eukprot:8695661-Alexandrium_andersonii.AAC.1
MRDPFSPRMWLDATPWTPASGAMRTRRRLALGRRFGHRYRRMDPNQSGLLEFELAPCVDFRGR